jgi:hypothetical protein
LFFSLIDSRLASVILADLTIKSWQAVVKQHFLLKNNIPYFKTKFPSKTQD